MQSTQRGGTGVDSGPHMLDHLGTLTPVIGDSLTQLPFGFKPPGSTNNSILTKLWAQSPVKDPKQKPQLAGPPQE